MEGHVIPSWDWRSRRRASWKWWHQSWTFKLTTKSAPCQCFKKKWSEWGETEQECSLSLESFPFARKPTVWQKALWTWSQVLCVRALAWAFSSQMALGEALHFSQPQVSSRCCLLCLPPWVVLKTWWDNPGANVLSTMLLQKWLMGSFSFGRSLSFCLPACKNEFIKGLPFLPHQPQAFRQPPWGCSEIHKHLFLAPASSVRKLRSPWREEPCGDSTENELLWVWG